MLYIAMEDFAIDMVMGDGWAVRVPLKPFTLIGATTKPESLSEPLKNRFVYNFHCIDYNQDEKHKIVERYLNHYNIQYSSNLIEFIARKVDTVPRKIHNLIVKIRDYLISHHQDLRLNENNRPDCESRLSIKDGGLTTIHQKYLEILQANSWAVWLKTISLQLGINEESVENEIEPLLLKSGLIEKTARGRILM
jgi:Holliday junction DNA helicase RuvB